MPSAAPAAPPFVPAPGREITYNSDRQPITEGDGDGPDGRLGSHLAREHLDSLMEAVLKVAPRQVAALPLPRERSHESAARRLQRQQAAAARAQTEASLNAKLNPALLGKGYHEKQAHLAQGGGSAAGAGGRREYYVEHEGVATGAGAVSRGVGEPPHPRSDGMYASYDSPPSHTARNPPQSPRAAAAAALLGSAGAIPSLDDVTDDVHDAAAAAAQYGGVESTPAVKRDESLHLLLQLSSGAR